MRRIEAVTGEGLAHACAEPHQRSSGSPLRWFSKRASTKSRSARRLA
jgi:hypothetical protein